jgi:Domain of unknown function (DUF4349)
MSTGRIGYIETVREDLLDAAWRSTMTGPVRVPRRRMPSRRWLIAAATSLTLLASGIVGWLIQSPGSPIERVQARLTLPDITHREPTVPGPSPAARAVAGAPLDQSKFAGLNNSPAFAAADQSGSQGASDQTQLTSGATASINPVGDLSKVIKTARMSIVVDHDTFGDRFTQIGDIADNLGGYLQSSSTTGGRSGFVTMRLPSNHFQAAIRALRKLGRVDSESIQGQDVTAQYIDMRARISIAKARRKVLFGLMQKASSISQTIQVQNALDDVQLRIEELQGDLNVLNDRVSQATIRISMREKGVKLNATETVSKPSIPTAFDRAVAGFLSVIAGVIVGLGWVLPSVAVLLLLLFIATRVRKRFA